MGRILDAGRVYEKDGIPAASGSIYFYTNGTASAKTTYSDAALTVENDAILTLNSQGRLPAEVFGLGLYSVRVIDTNGATVWTEDDVGEAPAAESYTPSGGTARTIQSKLDDFVSVKDFGAVGDGVYADNTGTDDAVALQAALDSQRPVYLGPGVYLTSVELVFKDRSQLHGAATFTGGRFDDGEEYDPTQHTIIKYIGAAGTDTCVLRLSKKAVGIRFGDTATDDLFNIQMDGITVDANGLADFGIYIYRSVDNNLGPFAAMRSKEAGIVITGCFTNTFTSLIGFGNEKNGIEVCGVDRWPALTTERNVHNNVFIRLQGRYNGTAKTYDGLTGSNVLEGHGLVLAPGRGNSFIGTSFEVNDGAGLYLIAYDHTEGGPNKFTGGYTEGNMALVVSEARATAAYNMVVSYRDEMRHWEFDSFYFSNSNSQDIRIVESGSPGVPVDQEAFFTIRNCFFRNTGQVEIDSNTSAYRVINCSPTPNYPDKRPGIEEISADGALDIVSPFTEITTTSVQLALTLPVTGVSDRFEKTIVFTSDGGFDAILTPVDLLPSGANTIQFNSPGDLCRLIFLNSKWHLLSTQGVIVA